MASEKSSYVKPMPDVLVCLLKWLRVAVGAGNALQARQHSHRNDDTKRQEVLQS